MLYKTSALLKNIMLTNFLLFWELALISRTCFRVFLKLGRLSLKSYLYLIFLLI